MKYLSLLLTTCLVFFLSQNFVYTATGANKATYKINKAVDQEGQQISSVKIYIDELYTHHLDNETLYFCDSCFCDDAKTIVCGLGKHLIKLIKTDYVDWVEEHTFVEGEIYEVSPSLVKITSVTSPTTTLSSTPTSTISPTPSPTISETVTPSPTPSPTSTKSIYKINKPKEEGGQLITGVKINVDNQYIHHEDDETIEFCDGCFCDTTKSVPCGLGDHTIKLTKSGYADWSEQRNFTQGNSFEITPILIKLPSSSNPTSTPSPTASSTPTKTPTPTKAPTLSLKALLASSSSTISAVLGESTDSADIVIARSASDVAIQSLSSENKKINPANYKLPFFIGLFVAVSSGALLYFRHRKD